MKQVSLKEQIARVKAMDKLKLELVNYETALKSSLFPDYISQKIAEIKNKMEQLK